MFWKKLMIIFIFISLSLLYPSSISSIQNIKTSHELNISRIIFVDNDNLLGPWDGTFEHPYYRIQDAINNSSNYDVIKVNKGIYYENLLIDKKLSLYGFNFNNTIIDGQFNNSTINILNDEVSLINFTIRNSGGFKEDTGILLNSKDCIIKDCIIYETKYGIIIKQQHNNVKNCSFRKNGVAVKIYDSMKNIIENCSFDHNSIGLNIDNSVDNKVRFCYLYANGIACFINNSKDIEVFHCNVSDNSVNIGGIFILSGNDIMINDSNINHNGVGISISSSNFVNITNCNIDQNTHFSISMRISSKNIKIINNSIENNKRYGIYIEKNNQCIIENNNILNNSLYDFYSEFSHCSVRNNWWGTKFGPIDLKFDLNKKIIIRGGRVIFFPWKNHEINNTGSSWNLNGKDMKSKNFDIEQYKINFKDIDSDEDGLPDWWENKWGYNPLRWEDHLNIDSDEDSLNNFQECYTDQWGSNPFYKDIFLEIDWMKSSNSNISNKPSINIINDIIQSFENYDIKLHIDFGELGGGQELDDICTPFLLFPKLTDIYFDFFLDNDLRNPRKGIFHYGIICNVCPDLNFPFFGWDSFDSFAISAQWLKNENPLINRSNLISGAILHHLGHTLKLHADIFEGIDNIGTINPFSSYWWKYMDYKSCMNYRYKYKILTFSNGQNGVGDFNDWSNIDFSFFKKSNFF